MIVMQGSLLVDIRMPSPIHTLYVHYMHGEYHKLTGLDIGA